MPPTSRASFLIDLLLECLLIALFIFLPAAFGTVDAWSEMIAFSVAAVMAALLALRRALSRERLTSGWIIFAPVALFVAIAFFQLITLPPGAMHALSPRTHDLKTE